MGNDDIYQIRTRGDGPTGKLPINEEQLREAPSGDLFGLTQSAGMGWDPDALGGDPYLILNTHGGVRAPDGTPIALGYHTGHWEIGLLVKAAAEILKAKGRVPYAAHCSDPCDGRTQGTVGMFDSLPFRNDAAIVMRRQIRSLPTCKGVIGVATCDKGLPAMTMALAGMGNLPVVLVPGGVTLPPSEGEDAGAVQTIGARFAHGMLTLDEAATLGCKACGTPGGGCQFLGTAATSQVVGEALGLAPLHTALAPSGSAVWREIATRAAELIMGLKEQKFGVNQILTDAAIHNAMIVHAAFGGSTNLLLHIPAIAHAAGLRRPTVSDWEKVNSQVPRLVSVLPNGPVMHPTVNVFLAGGVPEVMMHLRKMGLLDTTIKTVEGRTWDSLLDEWEGSERRRRFREVLQEQEGVAPDDVIMNSDRAKELGIVAAVAICPPIDPNNAMTVMNNGLFIYEKYFFRRWTRSLQKKLKYFPELDFSAEMNQIKTLEDVNQTFVPKFTPFQNPKDYFSSYALTGDRLKTLEIPAHMIVANDDPILPAEDVDKINASEHLIVERQDHGGHCGFIKDLKGRSWVEERLVEIFNGYLEVSALN